MLQVRRQRQREAVKAASGHRWTAKDEHRNRKRGAGCERGAEQGAATAWRADRNALLEM